MANDIIDTIIVDGKLTISSKGAFQYAKRCHLPEQNFIDEVAADFDGDDVLVDVEMLWCGNGADTDGLISALKLTNGAARILVVWEGGGLGAFEGLIVEDGDVTEGKVKITIEKFG